MPPCTCVTGHPENLPHPLPTIESTSPTRLACAGMRGLRAPERTTGRPASGASTGGGSAEDEDQGPGGEHEAEEEQRGAEERVEPESGQHVRPGVGDEQDDAAQRARGGEQCRRDLLEMPVTNPRSRSSART